MKYLDFDAASEAVEAAREQALAEGAPNRVPPVRLIDCDRSTIETALFAPGAGVFDQEFYPDLPSKAAVLLYTLAKSQACIDGNKRLALILVAAFLALNDAALETTNDLLADKILAAAESAGADRDGMLADLTSWLRESIVEQSERN